MTNKILNMIFKASDQATPTLDKLKGSSSTGIGGITSALKSMINPTTIALGAVTGLAAALKSGVSDWISYTNQVTILRDMMELTTEEASFLSSIMDRYGITQDTMVAVFRKMNRDGLEPTVENMKDLLFEYDNITDATEKMQFAQENFGEQGLKQVIAMWNSLTETQKENFGVQETGIVITDESITTVKGYETALFEFKTEFKKVWQTAGIDILPKLTTALEGMVEVFDKINNADFGPFLSTLNEWKELTIGTFEAIDTWLDNHPFLKGLLSGDFGIEPFLTGEQERFFEDKGFVPMGTVYQPGAPVVREDRRNIPYSPYSRPIGHATGGMFTVGGSGGSDSTQVNFRATPGETVSIGGGTSDMENILSEVRRLFDSLPVAIADAVERR